MSSHVLGKSTPNNASVSVDSRPDATNANARVRHLVVKRNGSSSGGRVAGRNGLRAPNWGLVGPLGRWRVARLLLEVGVVPEQLVHAAREGEEHEDEEEEELEDVHDHAGEGHLQRAEVRVDGEDVDQLQGTISGSCKRR